MAWGCLGKVMKPIKDIKGKILQLFGNIEILYKEKEYEYIKHHFAFSCSWVGVEVPPMLFPIIKNNPILSKSWGITSIGQKALYEIAYYFKPVQADFHYFNLKKHTDLIFEIIKDLAYKETIFNIEAIMNKEAKCLKDALKNNIAETTAILESEIQSKLLEIYSDQSVAVLTLPYNIRTISFEIECLNVSLIDCEDEENLLSLHSEYGVDFFSKKLLNKWKDKRVQKEFEFDSIFVLRSTYDTNHLMINSLQICKAVLGVVYSTEKIFENHVPHQSMRSVRLYQQIGHKESTEKTTTLFPEPLLGSFTPKIMITVEKAHRIKSWWARFDTLPMQAKRKIFVGLSFFLDSVKLTDINQFMKLYQFLDAIFGVQGKVEKSIKQNLLRYGCDGELVDVLYNLRCHIAHGEIASISMWEGYPRFITKYQSEPNDMLCQICIEVINKGIY